MSEQFELPTIEPRGIDHLYLALLPEQRAARGITGSTMTWSQAFGLRGRPVSAERLHLSLHWLGDRPSDRLLAIANAAATAVAGMSPFVVSFDRIASFSSGNNRPLVLLCGRGQRQLRALHSALAKAIRQAAPCQYKAAPFEPHITVLYDRSGVPERHISPVSWTVRDFVLIHSLVGQARHVRLGRWSLEGAE